MPITVASILLLACTVRSNDDGQAVSALFDDALGGQPDPETEPNPQVEPES